jgi:uncharacterized membrane protein HdeD (DUF308 family)
MIKLLSKSWWALAIRGVVAILFGILSLLLPALTLEFLILLFGAYALLDGISNAVSAIVNRKHDRAWWWFLLAGLAGVIVGILTFTLPGLTAIMLVYFIAIQVFIIGVTEIAAGIALRKDISGEWLMIIKGILSALFGLVLFIAPGAGALAMILMIGVYAILAGVLLILVAFRLRGQAQVTLNA